MNEPNEIERIVASAHALKLDAPIIHYRIVGDRIELWTIHGGPYIYTPPLQGGNKEGGTAPAKTTKKPPSKVTKK